MVNKALSKAGLMTSIVCKLALIFLACLPDARTAVVMLPTVIQSAQPTGIGSINPSGVASVPMPVAGYSPGIAAGMGPTVQAYGGSVMPASVPMAQQAAGVIITDAAGIQQASGGTNQGPIVAIDHRLLRGKSSATTPEPTAPAPPEEPAAPPDEPPAERSNEAPGTPSERKSAETDALNPASGVKRSKTDSS
ncbi:uncharacterized protein LOC144118786 [Amblyomma americanum]